MGGWPRLSFKKQGQPSGGAGLDQPPTLASQDQPVVTCSGTERAAHPVQHVDQADVTPLPPSSRRYGWGGSVLLALHMLAISLGAKKYSSGSARLHLQCVRVRGYTYAAWFRSGRSLPS